MKDKEICKTFADFSLSNSIFFQWDGGGCCKTPEKCSPHAKEKRRWQLIDIHHMSILFKN
jgi:hypothetical protein